MGGAIAAAGILPKVLAKSEKGAAAPAASALTLRPEPRAVARKDESL